MHRCRVWVTVQVSQILACVEIIILVEFLISLHFFVLSFNLCNIDSEICSEPFQFWFSPWCFRFALPKIIKGFELHDAWALHRQLHVLACARHVPLLQIHSRRLLQVFVNITVTGRVLITRLLWWYHSTHREPRRFSKVAALIKNRGPISLNLVLFAPASISICQLLGYGQIFVPFEVSNDLLVLVLLSLQMVLYLVRGLLHMVLNLNQVVWIGFTKIRLRAEERRDGIRQSISYVQQECWLVHSAICLFIWNLLDLSLAVFADSYQILVLLLCALRAEGAQSSTRLLLRKLSNWPLVGLGDDMLWSHDATLLW